MFDILLVEDNVVFQKAVAELLAPDARVVSVTSIAEARRLMLSKPFDLLLLDVGLPDGDGFKFCKEIREQGESTTMPIIFLTGRFDVEDKVQAFSLGADDYVTKPFERREFKARVLARLRSGRARSDQKASLEAGDLRLTFIPQGVSVRAASGEISLDLTRTEFNLLAEFVRRAGEVLKRKDLNQALWGSTLYVSDRTLDSHIRNLRKKLVASTTNIRSVYGQGYRLEISSKKSNS